MKVLEYIIRATDRTSGAIRSAISGATSMAKAVFSNLANIKAGWDMASSFVSGAAKRLWGAISEAFRFETLTVQFSVLMGSLTKARQRMKELAEFAASTPFQMEEVVVASRQLHVFSDGALGASDSLRMVGDAAAAVGQNIQEVSFWVGRAYSMIKGGQPFGEAAMRLQEMGIMTPEVRRRMEELQASGAANIEVWTVLADRLQEFRGGMAQLSQTGDGLVSTLKDTWTESVRTFGQTFADVSNTAISGLINWLGRLNKDGTIKEWAEKTLDVLYRVAGAAKAVYSGGEKRAQAWTAIKDVLVGGLELGASKAIRILSDAAPTIGAAIGHALKVSIGSVLKKAELQDAKFYAGRALGYGDRMGWFGTRGQLDEKEWEEVNRVANENVFGLAPELKDATGSMAEKRVERGLAAMRRLGEAFRADADKSARDLKDEAERSASQAAPAQDSAEKKRIIEDMARAQQSVDQKRAQEAAKAEAEERAKLAQKQIEAEHKARLDNIRDEAQKSAQSEAAARDRLSRANSAAQQAWGWYRDPESFKRQLAEEKADAAAEKQYAKDFDKLNDRRDWRTATRLTESEEAVRRVALAREEQGRAQRALEAIEKNTAGLESMLKQLLTSK